MSIVRVQTRALLGLLVDAARTAASGPGAGAVGGVLLSSGRGHHGTEPGRVELLGAIATDRTSLGYGHTYCSGQLPAPQLWSLRDLQAVVTVFKAAAGSDKDGEHAVEIDAAAAGAAPGEVQVREDPNLFGDGVCLTFTPMDRTDFPARTAMRVLAGDSWPPVPKRGPVTIERDGRTIRAGARLDVKGSALAPFVAVAKRRGQPLQLYTRHQLAPVLVQVGDAYRGAVSPWIPDDDTATDLPDVELHAGADLAYWPPSAAEVAARPLHLVDGAGDPASGLFMPPDDRSDP